MASFLQDLCVWYGVPPRLKNSCFLGRTRKVETSQKLSLSKEEDTKLYSLLILFTTNFRMVRNRSAIRKRQVGPELDGRSEPVAKEAKLKEVDADLEHVYKAIDTSTKSQSLFAEQNITDIHTLLAKESELRQGALPAINKSTQKQLHSFCLWYRSISASDIDWKAHFDEDTLSRFDNNRFLAALETASSSDVILEKDLEFVCDELDLPNGTRQQMAGLGITSMKALLARKTDLELFALADIKKTTQKLLLKICLWHEDFYTKNEYSTSWETYFNDETFALFEQEPSDEREYRMVQKRITEGRCISNVSDAAIYYGAGITNKYLSKHLVEQCRNKFNPFDIAVKCLKALMHPTRQKQETIYMVSGKTQSGKSTIKAVCAAVHRQLGCHLIIITKGVSERNDLKVKLNMLMGGCRETMDAGLLVIADTGGQIEKATKSVLAIRKDLPRARFGVIVGETTKIEFRQPSLSPTCPLRLTLLSRNTRRGRCHVQDKGLRTNYGTALCFFDGAWSFFSDGDFCHHLFGDSGS
jgi:hypothetical protein